jgi:hypothetical protein
MAIPATSRGPAGNRLGAPQRPHRFKPSSPSAEVHDGSGVLPTRCAEAGECFRGQRQKTDAKVSWTLVPWVAHTVPRIALIRRGAWLIAGASAPTLARQFEQPEVRTWPNSLKQVVFRSRTTNLR